MKLPRVKKSLVTISIELGMIQISRGRSRESKGSEINSRAVIGSMILTLTS